VRTNQRGVVRDVKAVCIFTAAESCYRNPIKFRLNIGSNGIIIEPTRNVMKFASCIWM
jgi:hypothetical protein